MPRHQLEICTNARQAAPGVELAEEIALSRSLQSEAVLNERQIVGIDLSLGHERDDFTLALSALRHIRADV